MLSDLRFLFITGKGGVGKTTVAAALGVKLASEGRNVLIAMCNAKERLSSLLGTDPIASAVVPVGERLWAVNMEPRSALREYGQLALKSRTLTNVLFDNRYVQSFFHAVPGMQEWTLLGKAWWHTTEASEGPRGGSGNKYDTVIVDGPATGHGLDMLRVPKIIVELVPPGLLRRDAERAWTMFQDPRLSGIVLATLPEDLPTTETLELCRSLKQELGLPVAHLFINCLSNTLFSNGDEDRLQRATLAPKPLPTSTLETLAMGVNRAARERDQRACVARLSALQIPTTRLPLLANGALSRSDIEPLVRLCR
jgi:anion-transporting  ArsA/GET3 family ATPase